MAHLLLKVICVAISLTFPIVLGVVVPFQVQTTFKIVSGLQLELVPKSSAHIYKEYVPLVFQFSIPRWNKSDPLIFGSQNCVATNFTKFFTTCPILYHLTEIHERFSEYLSNNQPLVVNLADIDAVPETTIIPLDCEIIKPHFEDIYVDKVTLDDYLNRLQACSPLGSDEFVRGISNYVYNISNIYSEMRRNFYSEYWLKIDLMDGRVDAALWSNAVNLFNSLSFQNYMMEANRWKLAVMDCEAGRIPSTILPPSLLADTLKDMLDSLQNKSLSPSVSIDTVGNYFKATLTDCTFTNDTFLVRILVPVIPTNEKFALVKISPVSFYYKQDDIEYTCQIDPTVLPSSPGGGGETYVLVDLMKNVAFETDCKPDKLCHISTELHPLRVNPCATAAFNWERFPSKNDTLRFELIQSCPVKCSPLHEFQRNSLQSLGNDQFLWFSGGTGEELLVNCSSYSGTETQNFIYKTKSISYGTFLVDTNCNCRLTYGSDTVKSKTCNTIANYKPNRKASILQVSRVAPVYWYPNLRSYKGLWSVSEDVFTNPDKQWLKKSLSRFGIPYLKSETGSSELPAAIVFLTLANIFLVFVVVAVAWRLYKLVAQLEGMGLNVGGLTCNKTIGTGNDSDQQVSYRNMDTCADTENLLINGT